jgi:malate dehydrogenase (quinone)
VKNCFPHLLNSPEGKARMKVMIPTYDVDIKQPEHAAFFEETHAKAVRALQLV